MSFASRPDHVCGRTHASMMKNTTTTAMLLPVVLGISTRTGIALQGY